MCIFENGDIVTKHFDIFEDICILDIPTENGWQCRYYQNHKLKKVENWEFNFASVRDTGESIQGTYQGIK